MAIIITFTFAPCIHPNHPISDKYKIKTRKFGKIAVLIESTILIMLLLFADKWVAQVGGLGMFTSTMLCIVGEVKIALSHINK